jgi:hypothetical protein
MPPFVAAPVGAALGKLAPAKELEAAPFTLADDVGPASASPTPPASSASTSTSTSSATSATDHRVSVSLPEAQDAWRGVELGTVVTLANDGDKPITLLFRPETIGFDVAGPAGSVSCGAARAVDAPIRELYSTVGVKGRTSLSVLLTTMCPPDTFDEPGIYRVTPWLDTTSASARSIGLKSWDATANGKAPMLLRVRSPRRPPSTTTRPVLD